MVLSWPPFLELKRYGACEGQLDQKNKISRGVACATYVRYGWGLLLTRRARQPVDGELSGRSSQRRPRLARAKGGMLVRCVLVIAADGLTDRSDEVR